MFDTLLHKPKNSGRFANLMDLYEQNYVLMRLLAPQLRQMRSGNFISQVPGAMTLELQDVKHSKYTTTFRLTYRFSQPDRHRRLFEPDLDIRIYHDARTCEVMSGLLSEGRLQARRTRDLEEGRRLNRFLNKWLGYCLRQGHGFGTQQAAVEACCADYCPQY